MSPPRSHRQLAEMADALHRAALERRVEARWAWVGEQCAGDPELRAAVELRLIGALTTPGLGLGLLQFPSTPPAEFAPGALIDGRYRVMHRIGEGGLGAVFLAHQESPVERKVAIKVLHAGLESQHASARFEAEISALSRMNHPYVAAIHDAGRTPGGRMYVVMEFIDGEPLDMFVSNHRLDLEATLKLFVRVCRGVQHAHQRGIIHRDLKPMNILVRDDGEPVPRIIDFGIARATIDAAAQTPRLTAIGVHVGTPEYMSPEQAGLLEAESDTVSDVYSLGVILYELLTGTLPIAFDGRREPSQWRRVLDEARVEPPSGRLRRGPATARPWQASRLVGDLDAIVMQAMAREPERRYASAAELAAEIERHLHGQPVTARTPGVLYVVGRALKRRPGIVIGMLVAIGGLVMAAVVVAAAARDRDRQRLETERALQDAAAQKIIAEQQTFHLRRLAARSATAAAITALWLDEAPATLTNLAAVPPEYRGWGWDLLEHLATPWESLHVIGEGKTLSLEVSPDDSMLALGAEDGTVRIIDTMSGMVRSELKVGEAPVLDLSFAPDGRYLAASDRDSSLAWFEVASGRRLWLRAGPNRISSHAHVRRVDDVGWDILASVPAAPSPDGVPAAPNHWQMALLGHTDGTTRQWLPPTFIGSTPVWWCNEADAPFLAASGAASTTAYTRAGVVAWTAPGRIEGIATGPCDRYLAADPDTWESRTVRSTTDGRLLTPARAVEGIWHVGALGQAGFVAWHEGQAALAIQDVDGALPPVRLAGHGARIRAIRFEHKGPYLWSSDEVGRLIRWRRDLLPNPENMAADHGLVMGGAIDREARTFVGTGWGMVRAVDASRWAPIWHRWLGRGYITAVDFGGDGRWLVVADWLGNCWLLAADDGRTLGTATIPGAALVAMRVVSPTQAIATTGEGEALGLAIGAAPDLSSGTLTPTWRHRLHERLPSLAIAPSPKGAWTALALSNPARIPEGGGAAQPMLSRMSPPERGGVFVFDNATGRERMALEDSRTMWTALAVSPDGASIYGGSDDGRIRRWDSDTGRVIAERTGVGGRVQSFTFSGSWEVGGGPSSPRVLMALDTGQVALWDATTDDYLFTLPFPVPDPVAMRLSSDEVHLGAIGKRMIFQRISTRPDSDPATRHRDARIGVAARRALDLHISPSIAAENIAAHMPSELRKDAEALRDAVARVMAWSRNPNDLNARAWGSALHRETFDALSTTERETVVRMAEVAADIGGRGEFENTRALVRLRNGDLDGAIAAARRSTELLRATGRMSSAPDRAIIAMALWYQGDAANAVAELTRARAEAEAPEWMADPDTVALLREAEGLIQP